MHKKITVSDLVEGTFKRLNKLQMRFYETYGHLIWNIQNINAINSSESLIKNWENGQAWFIKHPGLICWQAWLGRYPWCTGNHKLQ